MYHKGTSSKYTLLYFNWIRKLAFFALIVSFRALLHMYEALPIYTNRFLDWPCSKNAFPSGFGHTCIRYCTVRKYLPLKILNPYCKTSEEIASPKYKVISWHIHIMCTIMMYISIACGQFCVIHPQKLIQKLNAKII